MNKNTTINIVLALAVAILYVLHFTSGSNAPNDRIELENEKVSVVDSSNITESDSSIATTSADSLNKDSIEVLEASDLNTENLPDVSIAYVNIDILNQNYKYLDQLEREFAKEAKAKQNTLQEKAKTLQEEYKMFMEQVQSGAIDQQKAVQMDQSFKERQMELMQEEQQSAADLQMKQRDFHNAILEKISNYLNKYAQDFDYDYILAYGQESGVLYAKKRLDITNQVLEGLNKEL